MIVSFYTDNVSQEIVDAQKKVFDHFKIPLVQVKPEVWHGHGGTIDRFISDMKEWDHLVIFDIDCIPLDADIVNETIAAVDNHIGIVGIAQKASHIPNSIIYAGPAFIAFSRKTYELLGKPTFGCTDRSDCAAELTYIAREKGIEVMLLYPTSVEQKKWPLDGPVMFGPGTTFQNRIYHGFYSRRNPGNFIKKCAEITN